MRKRRSTASTDRLYNANLLFGESVLLFLRLILRIGNKGCKRQLEERMNGSALGVDGSNTRRSHYDNALRRLLLQSAQKRSLTRTGFTGKEQVCIGCLNDVPRELRLFVHFHCSYVCASCSTVVQCRFVCFSHPFQKESFWVAKGVLLGGKRSPFGV